MQPLWKAEREVDTALARQLVTSQFPALADSPSLAVERIGAGWDNVAFLVTGANGPFVFRFPRRSIAVPLIETETRLLPLLAPALPLPIPVPPPVTRATVPRWTSGRSTWLIYATGMSRNAVPRLMSSLATMTRWISEVPSQIRSTRTSRYMRSMGYARS